MEYESRLEKIPLLKKHLESAGITAETSYLEQIPERLVYRAKLDKRGWFVTALRSAANDPQCPTNDPSEAQIISEKESKLQMDSSVPEYRSPRDEPPQKIRKVNEASKYLQVEAVEMNDASKDDGEGSSSGTKRKTLKS
ncbi:hypothetical protein APHAL10511_002855 [Amanita phalloides]|nr:hypothetical protein APHAL10511_002855 [Amanita phalloides]